MTTAIDSTGGVPGHDRRERTRIRMLLGWYPRGWRARYGDEFAELLAAELAERPHSVRRAADIARSGLRTRLADAGLAGHPLDQPAAARAGLATFAGCAAAFGLFGLAMWSQLAIGAQWAVPRNHGVTQAVDLMSATLLTFAIVFLLGLAGVARAAVAAVRRGAARPLLLPVALALTGAVVLFAGGRHFANGWPGTGGHLLLQHNLVPPWLAAFCWATTMWITSYLAHPAALAAFPAGQLAWMAVCPAAACCLVTGAVQLLRRLDRAPGTIRYEIWLARIAAAGMILFTAAALRWLSSVAPHVMPAFHPGSIDLAGLAVLVAAMAAGGQAMRRSALAGQAMAAGAGSGAPGR